VRVCVCVCVFVCVCICMCEDVHQHTPSVLLGTPQSVPAPPVLQVLPFLSAASYALQPAQLTKCPALEPG